MRAVLGFLVGACACALVTTDRGRRLVADMADEAEACARKSLREISNPVPEGPEGERDETDDGRSADDA